MLKIIIFTASYGGGHNSVATEHLKEYYPNITVEVIDFMKRFVAFNNIMRMLYKQSTRRIPAAYGSFFKATDKLFDKPLWKKVLAPSVCTMEAFLENAKPDVVISTYAVAGIVSSILAKQICFKSAVVITDFGAHSQWIHPLTDLYFMPSQELKRFLVSKCIPARKIKVTAIPLRKEFSDKPNMSSVRKRFKLPNRFTALLMSGEYGICNLKKLCEKIAKSPIQLIIVCGRNQRLYNKISGLKRKMHARNILCIGYTEEVHNLMSVSDVLIGKAGGITVSESLAMNLPLIIYRPIPGQEYFNLDYLVNEGTALYARDKNDVLNKLRFLSENPKRLSGIREKISRIAQPDAAKTICQTLFGAGVD